LQHVENVAIVVKMVEHQEDKSNPQTVSSFPEKDEEKYVTTDEILKGAQQATDAEHMMSLREGLRKYPKACFWSLLFSAALIMEGFDKSFVNAFFAFPPFKEKWGNLQPDGTFEIPSDIQAGISNSVSCGQIIGLLINGYAADRFGYRWVMLCCLFLMMCFIFLQFFASSIYMYIGAGVLLGVPWGVFQTLTTTYAAEVCPNVLRPYLTSAVSLCWSIGYLIGTATLSGFTNMTGEWAFRIPYALQWALPIPLAIGIYFAPESPWWLARQGRAEEAERAIRALQAKGVTEEEIANTLSMMLYTVKIENEMDTRSSYKDLFKGTNLRRTEITVSTYLIQEILAPLVSYVVYFLQQSGVPTGAAFNFSVGQYCLAIVGVFIAWSLTPKYGRRTFILVGTTFMTLTTFLIGFLGIANPADHPKMGYGIGSILLVEYFVFFITCGPIIYTVVSECVAKYPIYFESLLLIKAARIPSNYLRTKSVVMGRVIYNVGVLIYGQLIPRMIQKASWNWGAKCGFFFGGWMAVGLVWAYFRLPETKNRTFAEIDILFKNEVKARDFAKTKVDLATQTVSKEE
jgi:MFS transporter, SP family, general alpha glucoside:H+ symporter